ITFFNPGANFSLSVVQTMPGSGDAQGADRTGVALAITFFNPGANFSLSVVQTMPGSGDAQGADRTGVA
ncbi:hypothetical protein CG417_27815, partial [Shigella sonnei]|uniref:hypothetical protein n=1 Tax=Shigella sonnei TaxID=624 RepID=UPI000B9F8AA2